MTVGFFNKILTKQSFKFTMLSFATIAAFVFACNQPQTKTDNAKQGTVVAKDQLPSWNEGASKQSIIDFVTKATKEGSAGFVPVADRIACFDNDGTLWTRNRSPFNYIL